MQACNIKERGGSRVAILAPQPPGQRATPHCRNRVRSNLATHTLQKDFPQHGIVTGS